MEIQFQGSFYDLGHLDYLTLVDLRYRMQTRQDQVKTMIAHTKRQIKLGHHDMHEQRIVMESESRNLGRKVQIATTYFGIAKARARLERQQTFEHLFVDLVKQEIPYELWERLRDQVNEIMKEE